MDKVKVKQEPGLSGSSNKKPNLKPNLTSPIKVSKDKLNSSNNRPSTTSQINNATGSVPSSSSISSSESVVPQTRKLIAKHNNPIKPKNKSIPSGASSSNISNISNPSIKIQVKKEPGLPNSNADSIKEKLSEFMVDIPDLDLKKKSDEKERESDHHYQHANHVENDDQEDLSSKFSSPFNSRVDTAGTNLTFLTKGTNADISNKNLISKKIMSNHRNNVINNKQIHSLSSSEPTELLKIRDSSEMSNDENSNLLSSSPCINRKFKQNANDPKNSNSKRKIDDQTLLKSFKKSKSKNMDESNKENESFNSTDANDGSLNDEEFEDEEDGRNGRPKTPIKFKPDSKPIFEYMEGEDLIYYDIMGKNKNNNENLELDENEKQFFEYVHYNFDQWKEQNEIFISEYNKLMQNVINARVKFNKRFQFLRKNLDEFAINLENHSDKISKKSEILKEYCNKIVTEID